MASTFFIGFLGRPKTLATSSPHGMPFAEVKVTQGRMTALASLPSASEDRASRGVPPRSGGDRAARGAAVGGGSDPAIHAGREPHQVAPRAHDLVLRGVHPRAAGQLLPSIRPTRTSTTRITRRSGPGTRVPSEAASRPSAADVGKYRATIDARVTETDSRCRRAAPGRAHPDCPSGDRARRAASRAPLDRHSPRLLGRNPLAPAYRRLAEERLSSARFATSPWRFTRSRAGSSRSARATASRSRSTTSCCGIAAGSSRSRSAIASSRCAKLVAFVRGGGYETSSLWLSEGWNIVQSQGIRALPSLALRRRQARRLRPGRRTGGPRRRARLSRQFLRGRSPGEISRGSPSLGGGVGGQWLQSSRIEGNLVCRSSALRPLPAPTQRGRPRPAFSATRGEWTRSSYEPYPGFVALPGALGEHNGKFMIGQMVLRGGSCFTPSGHVTASYRNFWPPATRFQLTGVRLARDIAERRG